MNRNLNDKKPYIGPTEHNYQQLDYDDGELAIINHLTYTPRMHATQIDKIFIGVCLQGEFRFNMDGQDITLEANDIFIGYPNAIYNFFHMSDDLDLRLYSISKPLLQDMLYPNQSVWNMTLYMKRYNIIRISPKEMVVQKRTRDQIMYYIQSENTLFRKEIIRLLVQAGIYGICRSLYKGTQMAATTKTNQKQILFDRFITLLSTNEIKKRQIDYYSNILCVSPRYLTMVCREISNKSAYNWINEYTQNDVRYYLLHTNLSIKEISIKLGFCNLSFFGKYVRENFGMSPTDFRRTNKNK
ncbi:MAG: AraC family transcriptional regulator [Prevotella sp.]|nr:AraC family transcriptional regulator [Prevotella sp.]